MSPFKLGKRLRGLCIFLTFATIIKVRKQWKGVKAHLSFRFHVLARVRRRVSRRIYPCAVVFVSLVVACLSGGRSSAQSASDNTIRGIVINSVTHEPIPRALVSSPDNRFAALTNGDGRFEFTFPRADGSGDSGSVPNPGAPGRPRFGSNRPSTLMARKPGFLSDPNGQGQPSRNDASEDMTLMLTPEGLIVGSVVLPTAEAPDPIRLQIYRRQLQDGRARYIPAGGAQSASDGQFRFANLVAGTYKLLTQELLDRDQRSGDPFAEDSREPLFGYPPAYYQNAPDFGSASTIQLAAGQVQNADISLSRQPYFRVKVPVIVSASDAGEQGVGGEVNANGRKGPGFSLGYNNRDHAIEGMLPSGTYTVEASNRGAHGLSGWQTITVKGEPGDSRMIVGPGLALLPNASIRVLVREEFTSDRNRTESPRHYLSVNLESADDFAVGRNFSARDALGDDSLVIDGATPGNYWVQVHSSRGYVAAIRSGNLDLLRQPMTVGAGGGASAIEVTVRDDTAEISGTVDGIAATGPGGGSANTGPTRAHVYFIPLAESGGQYSEASVRTDGSFVSQGLAPGAYRVLAFDRVQTDLEYRNPEAMQAYESKGPTVRVVGGQKERVELPLISKNFGNDQ
jgi:hypothetical protein